MYKYFYTILLYTFTLILYYIFYIIILLRIPRGGGIAGSNIIENYYELSVTSTSQKEDSGCRCIIL